MNNLLVFSDVLRQMAAIGNSTGILQLEIQLDHLTNFESTVNGTTEIANPLINLDADSSDFKSNVNPKRIHQIKNPNLDLLKGTRNPFLDSPKGTHP